VISLQQILPLLQKRQRSRFESHHRLPVHRGRREELPAAHVTGEIATLEGLGFNLKRSSGEGGGIMHNKYMIIDGKVLFTGSYNWSANAEDNNFENAMFIQASSVIQKFQADFEKIWVR